MRHFNYFPNGGPTPGVCALCGDIKELWDTGAEHARGGSFMICTRCIGELAENIGYSPRIPYEDTIAVLKTEINKLTEMLDRIPNLTEGLINGVRSIVTDFVFAVSDGSEPDGDSLVQDVAENIGASVESDEPADISIEAPSEPISGEGSTSVPAIAVRKRTAGSK